MEIKIFDVEHGFCGLVLADNGNIILIDCGHNRTTGFRPSAYLRADNCTGIEKFIVSNYDEDHLSDLPNLARLIHFINRNRSINANDLRSLKLRTGPIQPGMEELLGILEGATPATNSHSYPGIDINFAHNDYPTFTDTNNLSLVTFLHYRDIHIIFPGDLERAGWRPLLEDPSFRQQLERVNIFVASHHGRESGYCEEVFNYCQPELVVISDESVQYETQETEYSRHARGIRWGEAHRYVFTTRNDGMITISQRAGENPQISTSR